MTSLIEKIESGKIILDSGASEHYTPNKDWLIEFTESSGNITVANGEQMPIKGKGSIPILLDGIEILITNINYIPNLKATLISTKQLANKGWSVLFSQKEALISHPAIQSEIKAN